MTSRRHQEAGDTLIEILITIVVIGITALASFYAISVAATSSKSHRDAATADSVLRVYAEATKQEVRTFCKTNPAGTAFPTSGYPAVPAGFSVSATGPNGLTCPSPTTVNQINITATVPGGITKLLSIAVRTP